MSGLSYRAISYGPVPENWDRVYSQFDEIHQEPRIIGDFEGNVLASSEKPDETLFTLDELAVLDTVCTRFGLMSSREISALSHKEKAWLDSHENRGRIPFFEAFELKAV